VPPISSIVGWYSTGVPGEAGQVAWRDAHVVDRRTLRAPEQHAECKRRNLRRPELLEIGIRAWRQMATS